jgi:hypothetical protein
MAHIEGMTPTLFVAEGVTAWEEPEVSTAPHADSAPAIVQSEARDRQEAGYGS